jgi:hypothetical protein
MTWCWSIWAGERKGPVSAISVAKPIAAELSAVSDRPAGPDSFTAAPGC